MKGEGLMHRKPYAAGSFYPSDADAVNDFIENVIQKSDIDKKEIKGIILPHAGWVFSGETALKTLLRVKNIENIDTFVLFGAVHTTYLDKPVLFDKGVWETPLGDMEVNEDLIKKYKLESKLESNPKIHQGEHSIEVQLPFLKYLNSSAKIIPISVPNSIDDSLDIYIELFEKLKKEKILFIASTDLTHYGRRFGYAPEGTGQTALNWVKHEKDPGFIDLIKNKKYKKIIKYSNKNNSACGAGGVALITGLLKNTKINLEEYTTSADEYEEAGAGSFVTYTGISFEKK